MPTILQDPNTSTSRARVENKIYAKSIYYLITSDRWQTLARYGKGVGENISGIRTNNLENAIEVEKNRNKKKFAKHKMKITDNGFMEKFQNTYECVVYVQFASTPRIWTHLRKVLENPAQSIKANYENLTRWYKLL